jgi:hypothetical protein
MLIATVCSACFLGIGGLGVNRILVCGRLCGDHADGGRLWQLK